MERVNFFFLHGFLGRPTDWAMVKAFLPQREDVRIFTPDYFKELALSPQNSFSAWADNFTGWAEQYGCGGDRNILVGYSLGGRLALHALEKNSKLWNKVMVISTNPGFDDMHDSFNPISDERKQRWLSDSYWAEEFLKAPWESVLRDWNSQPVFGGGSNEPVRLEKDYSRELLSLALTHWSLAQQKNMRSTIKNNMQKLVWVVGERDEKFMETSRRLHAEISGLNFESIPDSSHRVLFDSPKELGRKIAQLIR